jgi:MIP family channel proteins
MNNTIRNFVAEFVGTFALVFIGSGAIMMANRSNSPAGLAMVALAHGIILSVMVAALIDVSGAQFNPSVTIGLLVGRRIAPLLAGVHIAAQLVGGIAAAYVLSMTVPQELFAQSRGGGQSIALDITLGQAVTLEVIATFFLMFVIYGVAVSRERPLGIAGFAIGLTIAADILAIGPLTGASMNPARSLGPAVASGVFEGQIAYWVGPIVGAVLAAIVWEFVILKRRAAAAT